MPIFMGIHCKPIGHSHSASLDSRVRGNDGGMFFSRKRLKPQRHKDTKSNSFVVWLLGKRWRWISGGDW
jgi:hypothetical protein